LINLLAIALYHDKQATVLNGTAAAVCALISLLRAWHHWHVEASRRLDGRFSHA